MAERIATLYSDQRREAPALVKKDGIYYMLTPGQLAGRQIVWALPTATSMAVALTSTPLPTFSDNWSFYTQPAFIMTVPGTEMTSHIYVGDRWHPTRLGALSMSGCR